MISIPSWLFFQLAVAGFWNLSAGELVILLWAVVQNYIAVQLFLPKHQVTDGKSLVLLDIGRIWKSFCFRNRDGRILLVQRKKGVLFK